MKRIVIIGGMGPQASIELHQRIIDGAISRGAENGGDFPNIMHLSIPVRDFIDGTGIALAVSVIKQTLNGLYLWSKRSHSAGMQHGALVCA